MAQLHKDPYPGEWGFRPEEPIGDYFKRTDALKAAIDWSRVMTFPVADGMACYFVVSENPLTLQHIPCDDAWRIRPAEIRGITSRDWLQAKAENEFWREQEAKNAKKKEG